MRAGQIAVIVGRTGKLKMSETSEKLRQRSMESMKNYCGWGNLTLNLGKGFEVISKFELETVMKKSFTEKRNSLARG